MDEFVTGRKRSGKTKLSLLKILMALKWGRFVATNISVDISKLPLKRLSSCKFDGLLVRLPDVPKAEHLVSLGLGYEGAIDESKNGLIVLDEASLCFDSYQFQDKELQSRFEYLINSGKNRYSIVYLVHDIETISARVRKSFAEHITECYTVHAMFNLHGSKLQKIVPQFHIAKTRLASKGRTLRKGFSKTKFFKLKELEDAYDTEQRYKEALPILAPFKEAIEGEEGYIIPKHPLSGESPPKGHKFIDIRAAYTVLPPRLTGADKSGSAKKKEIVSLLKMSAIFAFCVYWLFFRGGAEESNTDKVVENTTVSSQAQVAVKEQVVDNTVVVKQENCSFLSALEFLPRNESFTDNWFVDMLKEYKPVVKDYNYFRGAPSEQMIDFNLLFFNEEGAFLTSTNSIELEAFGWHSFNWSRGVALVQKTAWIEESQQFGKILNRRETFILLQADKVPPSFDQAIAEAKGKGDGAGGVFSGMVSAVAQ